MLIFMKSWQRGSLKINHWEIAANAQSAGVTVRLLSDNGSGNIECTSRMSDSVPLRAQQSSFGLHCKIS